MINVCAQCGQFRADKIIDPEGPFAICPECGYQHRFLRMPLLVIGGASGSGKSAVCNHLVGQITNAIVLDGDILWREEFNSPQDRYRDFFETWLRMCKNIAQSGRPVVLFGAGFGVPENLENCIERRYFSQIHYLALVCSDEALSERLQQRPAWRATSSRSFIEENQRFNQWFKKYPKGHNQPSIGLIETTNNPLKQTASQVGKWIKQTIAANMADQ